MLIVAGIVVAAAGFAVGVGALFYRAFADEVLP